MLSVGELTRINLILKFLSSKITFIASINITKKKQKVSKNTFKTSKFWVYNAYNKISDLRINEKLKAFRFSFLGRNQAKPYNQQSGFTQSTCIYHLFTQLRVR